MGGLVQRQANFLLISLVGVDLDNHDIWLNRFDFALYRPFHHLSLFLRNRFRRWSRRKTHGGGAKCKHDIVVPAFISFIILLLSYDWTKMKANHMDLERLCLTSLDFIPTYAQ